jgi:hypothetical protein
MAEKENCQIVFNFNESLPMKLHENLFNGLGIDAR